MDSQTKEGGRGTKKTITVDPFGGQGGAAWDDGSFTGIREITLVYDWCIDSIRVKYDNNGKSFLAEKHGGNGGNHQANINLQYPEEILTSINGHYAPVVRGQTPVIRSLTFKSNKRSFGPYGMEVGTPFNFQIADGVIVGFRGRCGWYLDAIGFRLSPPRSPSVGLAILQLLKKLGSNTPKLLGSSHA